MGFRVDMKEYEDLAEQFKTLARKYPHVTKATVNNAAFATRGVAQRNIRRDFVLRNKRTVKGVQVERARTLRISRQEARVGSLDPWMKRQEFGGIIIGKGKGKRILTARGAGLPEGARPVTKLQTRANRLANIKLLPRGKKKRGLSKRAQGAIKVKMAIKRKKKHVFLDLGKKKGLFKIVGRGRNKEIEMVHDLSRRMVRTPRAQWLLPAVRDIEKQIPKIYRRALIDQAIRNGLFGY